MSIHHASGSGMLGDMWRALTCQETMQETQAALKAQSAEAALLCGRDPRVFGAAIALYRERRVRRIIVSSPMEKHDGHVSAARSERLRAFFAQQLVSMDDLTIALPAETIPDMLSAARTCLVNRALHTRSLVLVTAPHKLLRAKALYATLRSAGETAPVFALPWKGTPHEWFPRGQEENGETQNTISWERDILQQLSAELIELGELVNRRELPADTVLTQLLTTASLVVGRQISPEADRPSISV